MEREEMKIRKAQVVLLAVAILCQVGTGDRLWGRERQVPGDSDSLSLLPYVQKICEKSTEFPNRKKSLVVLVEFLKFGCVTCLNNFMDLCDTIKFLSKQTDSPNVILIFERDNQIYERQYGQMKSWVEATGLRFPFRIAPPGIFEENHLTDIVLILLDRDCTFSYYQQLPLSEDNKRILLRRLFGEGK